MRRVWLLSAVVFASCVSQSVATPSRSLGPNERWLPVANWTGPNGQPVLCAGGGFPQEPTLRGDPSDPRVVWMIWPDGHRTDLAWPVGFSARFDPGLEVVDESGKVVAHDGTHVTGGCPTQDQGVMYVGNDLATSGPST